MGDFIKKNKKSAAHISLSQSPRAINHMHLQSHVTLYSPEQPFADICSWICLLKHALKCQVTTHTHTYQAASMKKALTRLSELPRRVMLAV